MAHVFREVPTYGFYKQAIRYMRRKVNFANPQHNYDND